MMQGKRVRAGEYQIGIYTIRRVSRRCWRITVEDGKGLPFDPVTRPTFAQAHLLCTGELPTL